MTDFLAILKREVEASTIVAVAERIGYSRTSVSHLLHGRYPGNPHKIAAKIIEVFADQIVCPHLDREITPQHCVDLREAPMPTSNAKQLRHWTACQNCPNNPGPVSPRLIRAQADRAAGPVEWWKK